MLEKEIFKTIIIIATAKCLQKLNNFTIVILKCVIKYFIGISCYMY